MTTLSPEQKRKLRGIGHGLKAVVQVGQQGLTEGVRAEVQRALEDHELIKVQLPAGDPKQRKALAEELARATGAELVQSIGRISLYFRENPQANPKHSNVRK